MAQKYRAHGEIRPVYAICKNRALVTEGRLALYQENQFGSKSEKMSAVAPDDQVNIFNEVEASFAEDTPEPTIEVVEMSETMGLPASAYEPDSPEGIGLH